MTAKQARHLKRLRERARRKRGVVLLIVISLLVLFVLLGVTYAVIASRYKDTAVASKRLEIYRDRPQLELDRVFYDLLREPSYQYSGGSQLTSPANPYPAMPANAPNATPGFSYDSALASAATGIGNSSALAGHSLLRDLYGIHASGFGEISNTLAFSPPVPAVVDSPQFIRFQFFNTTTLLGDAASPSDVPNAYSGCWIHFVSGPYVGESVRIRGYDPSPAALLIDATSYSGRSLFGFDPTNTLTLSTLVGSRFLLSGRPYGGTGHGWQPGNYAPATPANMPAWGLTYNAAPQALNADQQDPVGQFAGHTQTDGWHRVLDAAGSSPAGLFSSSLYGAMFPPPNQAPSDIRQARKHVENLVALMPHFAKYENAARSLAPLNLYSVGYVPDPGPSVALRNLERDPGPYMHSVQEDPQALSNPSGTLLASNGTNIPPTFAPLNPERGGANEAHDAYDPQNMFLSMMMPLSGNPNDVYIGPSFHQGPLINYWFNRMTTQVYDSTGAINPAQSGALSGIPLRSRQVAAFLFPYGDNGILDDADGPAFWQGSLPTDWRVRLRYVESVTRRIMFRPSVAMNPSFTGSNPIVFSPVAGVPTLVRDGLPTAETYTLLTSITDDALSKQVGDQVISGVINAFPTGGSPRNAFDVDNDGDGKMDSVWIDPGLPIVTLPDGRRYKRLVAIMVQDLDNRLNLNAVGNYGQVAQLSAGPPVVANITGGVMPGDFSSAILSSVVASGVGANMQLTRGLGVGPADIDPSILFSGSTATLARLLQTRYSSMREPDAAQNVFFAQPGLAGLDPNNNSVNDYQALRKLFGPVTAMGAMPPFLYMGMGSAPGMAGYTLAGSSPLDVQGRGTIYLDKFGHPIFYNFGFASGAPAVNGGTFDIVNSTYESDPYGGASSDAPFTLNDLERLLRPTDLDVVGVNTRLMQALGGATDLPRLRSAVTTLSSHIPSVNFTPPLWLKRNWTQATMANITSTPPTLVYTTNYPCSVSAPTPPGGIYATYPLCTPLLQRLLSSASLVEVAKARLPALGDQARPVLSYTFRATPPNLGDNNAYDTWFQPHPNGDGRSLGMPLLQPWQQIPPLPNPTSNPTYQAEINSLAGWDSGLRFEAITYDDQLRRMLPWEILHGEKLNLNRYFEDESPTFLGAVGASGSSPAYANQNDVPDIRGYLRFAGPESRMPHNANGGQLLNTRNVYLSQRQLLARHLYCLMSLVIDPNVADFMFKDEIEFRVTNFTQTAARFAGLTDARWAAREMLSRKIAQWAVNAVDSMDPDGVMTPFEYDVNPWNGWSVDGILGTEDDVDPLNFPERRLVWGTEQPDMVITESLATHDRRVHDSPYHAMRTKAVNPDDDMDQLALPQGSLYVELRNPRNPEVRPGAVPVESADRSYGPQPLYEYNGGLDRTRLRVDAVATVGGLSTPVWRLAISEHIPAATGGGDSQERQDYLPERHLVVTGAGTPIRQSFSFEPSYDYQSSVDAGNNASNTVLREYVATSPFVGNFDADTNQERPASSFVLDGRSGGTNLYVNRTPTNGYMNGYAGTTGYVHSNAQRYRCRCELERFVYFTNGSPNLFTKQFQNGTNLDNSRTFSAYNASGNTAIYLSPQQFMVVGPRQTTNFGAIQARSLDPENPFGAPENIFDLGKGDLGWSLHRISLNPPGFTPRGNTNGNPVACYDANGVLMTPGLGDMNFPPVAVIAQRFQQLDATDNTSVLNYDNGHQNNAYRGYVGLSVTEPLHLTDDQATATSPTYYRSRIDTMATGPAGFFGAVSPPDQADEPYVPDEPLDFKPYAPLLGLEDGAMKRSGTYDNRRIVFLQRLADPRVPWHRDANPYITIDWQTTDVTVFSGLDNTRKTTNGQAATSAQQQDGGMPPQFRGVDVRIDPTTGQELVDDPYSSTTDPDYIISRMRSQAMTRERGFRNYSEQFERLNYLNFWNPVTLSTWWANPATPPVEAFNRYAYGMITPPTLGLSPMDWRRLPDFISKQEQISEDNQILEFRASQIPTLTGGSINVNALLNTLGYENYSLGQRQTTGAIVYQDGTPPWNGIHDRPLASAMELLTVPASPTSRLGADFILPALSDDGTASFGQQSAYSANARIGGQPWGGNGLFPSLLNMQGSSADSEYDLNLANGSMPPVRQFNATADPNWAATGAAYKRPDFVRIFDLVDTPSRFNGTEQFFYEALPNAYASANGPAFNSNATAMQPKGATFSNNGSTNNWAGWESYRFPYNRASTMREPGKINLNTLYDSGVYAALVGGDRSAAGAAKNSGGPAYDGFTRFLFSRRGIPIAMWNNNTDANSYGNTDMNHPSAPPVPDYALTPQIDVRGSLTLNAAYPAFVNNPFRPASTADLMPAPVYADRTLTTGTLRHNLPLRNQSPVDTTILRKDIVFGPQDEQPLFSYSARTGVRPAPVDHYSNPYFRFQSQEQLANLVSGTSNVFAIWLTIGYFEVEPNYVNRDMTGQGGTGLPPGFVTSAQIAQAAAALGTVPPTTAGQYLANNANFIHIEYDVNHPDGTRLGMELGADDATFARHRGFYIVDRSIPVAFEPGKTHNTDRCVLLKRFIE